MVIAPTSGHFGHHKKEPNRRAKRIETVIKWFSEQSQISKVWLLAKSLYNRKLSVVDGVTLMSHAQVSAKWKETDHTDPIDYLASHGKTWANLVADVIAQYNEMEVNDLKLQTLILYSGDADLQIAADLAQHFSCPIVQAVYATADLLNSATTKYQVGGATTPAGVTLLSGADRFGTMKAVLKTLVEI